MSRVIADGLSKKVLAKGLTFTGDIAAPKVTASTGILFGTDTAAANTLDDYEEGTWSPTGGNDANITGVTYSDSRYTKTGRMVTVSGKIAGTITSTNSEVRIKVTLPFLPHASDWSSNGLVVGFLGSGLNRMANGAFTNGGNNTDFGFIYINGRQINTAGAQNFKYSITYEAS